MGVKITEAESQGNREVNFRFQTLTTELNDAKHKIDQGDYREARDILGYLLTDARNLINYLKREFK